MHDGIEIEKMGIPAVVICTSEFEQTGKAIAQMRGLADYPFVVIPHPIGTLSEEALADRAKQALSEVIRLLKLPAAGNKA